MKKKEPVVVSFVADKISVENVIPYPLLTKYSRTSGNNMKNFEKYKNLLGENEFKFFTAFIVDMYWYKDLKYTNNDISINFENIMKPYDSFSIKFLDVSFDMDEDKFKDIIEILKENKIGPNCMRIVDYNNNRYEVGLLLSKEEEIIITCRDILFEGDNCTLFDHNWIDLGKTWDMTYEKMD